MQDATPLAEKIRVLADQAGCAAVEARGGQRCEFVMLNTEGKLREFVLSCGSRVTTDAQAVYLDHDASTGDRMLIRQATQLTIDDDNKFRSKQRQDWESL